MQKDLTANLKKLQTTELGIQRIKKNLRLSDDVDVVAYSKDKIKTASAIIRQGKNWYVHSGDAIITINAHSFTRITAHAAKNGKFKLEQDC